MKKQAILLTSTFVSGLVVGIFIHKAYIKAKTYYAGEVYSAGEEVYFSFDRPLYHYNHGDIIKLKVMITKEQKSAGDA